MIGKYQLTGYVVVVAEIVELNVMMPVSITDGVKVIPPRGQMARLASFTKC